MDILLIIIILLIVIAIGYILSRPFISPPAAMREAPTSANQHEIQYQTLLKEIKSLQAECETSECPEDIASQLKEKKRAAANVLREIDSLLDDEDRMSWRDKIPEQTNQKPRFPKPQVGSYFCPQCGNQVISSDKFCTICGHRLQP